MLAKPLPVDDLDAVVRLAGESFAALRGGPGEAARIFVTGGTGFFGHWLVESLLRANEVLGLGVRVTLLTRDAARFRAASPWVAEDAAVTLVEGDVRGFEFPAGGYRHVIHAATDSGGQQDESSLREEIVEGTRRVLEFARRCGARRFLYVSTGAVYGRARYAGEGEVVRTPESYLDAVEPELPEGSYEAAKQAAELLCQEWTTVGPLEPELTFPLEPVIARCFAFVGPRLPLDAHYAMGNFIGDAMAGREIRVKGDGTAVRSYLYTSDLAAWLWTMLVKGKAGRAYNVGSEEAVSIEELARVVAETVRPGLTVQVEGEARPGVRAASYVPSVERARAELGLEVTVGLREAIAKTAAWYREWQG